MTGVDSRTDWQRRYEESLAKEREALRQADDVSDAEVVATETSMWLPGWIGAAVLAFAGVVGLLRRRARRVR